MRFLLLFALFTTTTFAQDVRVIQILKKTQTSLPITLEEDSFEPNILGYACPWPGLRVPLVFDLYAKLNHGRYFSKNVLAIKEGELQRRFCGRPTPLDVFGEEFIIGKEVQLPLTVELALVEVEWDGKKETVLRETISTILFGKEIESIANVELNIQE